MNKLILALTILLSACGEPVPETMPETAPVKDTLIIFDNGNYQAIDKSLDYEAMIVNVSYSQASVDDARKCPLCFVVETGVILGDDKDCAECLLLPEFLDYYERDRGVKVFIVFSDILSFRFAERILANGWYSDVVLVSANEDLLNDASYNYELALIGETDNTNIDYHITGNSECSAKCISPSGGVGLFDGVIAQP